MIFTARSEISIRKECDGVDEGGVASKDRDGFSLEAPDVDVTGKKQSGRSFSAQGFDVKVSNAFEKEDQLLTHRWSMKRTADSVERRSLERSRSTLTEEVKQERDASVRT